MKQFIVDCPEIIKLGKLESCDPIDSGLESRNFLLKIAGQRYVLKLYRNTSIDEIKFELSVLKHLRMLGSDFPYPVTGIIQIDNTPGVLYSFMSGKGLKASDITLETISKVAALQAEVHQALIGFSPEGERKRFSIFDLGFLDEFKCKYSPDESALLDQAKYWLSNNLQIHRDEKFPKSIIHEDLEMENVFLDEEGSIKFIDFGESHYAEVISDIATAIKELIINIKGLDLTLIEQYLSSYRKHNRLLDEIQLTILYPLIVRRTLFMLSYFLYKQSKAPSPTMAEKITVEKRSLRLLLSNSDVANKIIKL